MEYFHCLTGPIYAVTYQAFPSGPPVAKRAILLSFRHTSSHEARIPEMDTQRKQRQMTYETLYVGPKTVL